MGDVRADARGTATSASTGKRVARHAAEQPLSSPYVGRRVAKPFLVPPPPPAPAAVAEPVTPYVGRRIARVVPEVAPEPVVIAPVVIEPPVCARIATEPVVIDTPAAIEQPLMIEPIVIEPIVLQPALPEPALPEPAIDLQPNVSVPETPLTLPPTAQVRTDVEAEVEADVVEPVPPQRLEHYAGRRVAAKQPRHPLGADRPAVAPPPRDTPPSPTGRRVADRRSRRRRKPSMPLLGGIAVLALSAGGALQAVSPGLGGSGNADHLAPASAMSGSSAVASANLLGSRGTVVSRDSDRLQAAADAKVKERDQALSAFAAKAQKQAAEIKLHQWVLPVATGAYHLTARFGEYSYLWANMHTGLDFAADTGTPIMAVAGGTITEVGYSGAYGNRTIETLPDGTELWYCHQNEFGTSVGATVRPGQVIGYVGSTGNVTGPHLHLEVHPGGGDPVDPYTALQVHGLNP